MAAPWGVQWDSNQPVGMSTVVAPWGVPCSGCRVPQLVGRFPPPLYKQLQNIPNQTKAAAQNTLPCSVLRPFFVSSASQLLQDILESAGELDSRAPYEKLVTTEFAKKAME